LLLSGKWKGYRNVAIKQLKPGSMLPETFQKEAAVMKKLRHEKLVALLAVCSTEPLCIITELLRESLLDFLKKIMDLHLFYIIDMAKQVWYAVILENQIFFFSSKYLYLRNTNPNPNPNPNLTLTVLDPNLNLGY